MTVNTNDILVSYNVSALITNVPLDETIEILTEKAFTNNWFNKTHDLDISEANLIEFLRVALKETSTLLVQRKTLRASS